MQAPFKVVVQTKVSCRVIHVTAMSNSGVHSMRRGHMVQGRPFAIQANVWIFPDRLTQMVTAQQC